MKYKITTIVEAVQIKEADADCIQELREMLPNVPYMFTADGLQLTNPDGGDLVPFGDYIVKETTGNFVVITKEAFEKQSEPLLEVQS